MMTMEKRKESFDCVESVDSPFSALIMKIILFFLFPQFYLSMFPAATIIYYVHYVNLHICTCSRFPVPNLVVCVCVISRLRIHTDTQSKSSSQFQQKNQKSKIKRKKKTPPKNQSFSLSAMSGSFFFFSSLKSLGGLA